MNKKGILSVIFCASIITIASFFPGRNTIQVIDQMLHDDKTHKHLPSSSEIFLNYVKLKAHSYLHDIKLFLQNWKKIAQSTVMEIQRY